MFFPVLVAAGVFTTGLGIVHLMIPAIVRYASAIGRDEGLPSVGRVALPGGWYELRRADLVGLTWVMSNAASYVLITIGVVDLGWAFGWRGIPIGLGAVWIGGWWAIRAGGQFFLGRRSADVVIAAWFGLLAGGHLLLAAATH